MSEITRILIYINIIQVTSDEYVTVRKDGSLHIERVRLEDAGDYTCLAESVVGATNQTTTVNVYGIVHKHTLKFTMYYQQITKQEKTQPFGLIGITWRLEGKCSCNRKWGYYSSLIYSQVSLYTK